MRWDGSTHCGFSSVTPFVAVDPQRFPSSATVGAQAADSESIYSLFRRLANVRRRTPALQANASIPRSYGRVPTQDDRSFYAYLRTGAKPRHQKVLVVFNLSSEAREVLCMFSKTEYALEETHAVRDLCSNASGQPVTGDDYTVAVPAYGFRILEI